MIHGVVMTGTYDVSDASNTRGSIYLKDDPKDVTVELCEFLEPVSSCSPLAISFEIQEIHPVLTFKQNNLREYMATRQEKS